MRLPRLLILPLAASTLAVSFAGAPPVANSAQPAWDTKVDPWVISRAGAGPTEFLVYLAEQSDLTAAEGLKARDDKGRYVSNTLRATAARTQGPLLALLNGKGVQHRPYWVANMIWVRGGLALVEELARRDDVAHVYANPSLRFHEPVEQDETALAPDAIEWGVARVRAPEAWAAGFTGQGVVIGGQDTGYRWDHAALKNQYRGWNGTAADHNYNWHDSIHGCGPNSGPPCGGTTCGLDSAVPCDDQGHGTHTMGTMVGDDGATNQIGVAPGAKWMGCRNMDRGDGSPATYSECFQWFIAPTDLANQNPDPTRAPHVINNSWGCPPSEGCNPASLQTVVENTRAAGIVVVVSAGNAGANCSTVVDPPAIYGASFSVGSTTIGAGDPISSFSSRGPVIIDGSNRLKPNISAPGSNIRSSLRTGGYGSMSGTSMAGPHVAGVVGLFLSAFPQLRGHVSAIESALMASAAPRTSAETCGGVPGSQIPNNTFGWGRVDALAAITDLIFADGFQ
jgi:serine protease AprX